MEKVPDQEQAAEPPVLESKGPNSDGLINASGHRQELDRNFHFIHIAGLGITSGNTWIALGGSIVSWTCTISRKEKGIQTHANKYRL
jgi:choline transport protein